MKLSAKGFTLAEVLISLAIIGIIASITIHSLNSTVNEKEAVSKLFKVYSSLSQVIGLAIAQNGPIEYWYDDEDKIKNVATVFEILKPHLNIAKYCGFEEGCFSNNLKGLNGAVTNGWFGQKTDRIKLVLADGSAIAIVGASAPVCELDSSDGSAQAPEILKRNCFGINVDINGKNPPNQRGKDIFDFQVFKNGEIIPLGTPGFKTMWSFSTCNISSDGTGCAAWVILKGNMDYLKRNVSWDE